MSVKNIASADASKWARAEMFFGQGAGTRRKLLSAEIAHKTATIPGYSESFAKAYKKQNFAEHAIKAAKERKRLDRTNVVGRNFRALVRGDRRNMSAVLAVGIFAGYYAHENGYDTVIIDETKKRYRKTKAYAAWKIRVYKDKSSNNLHSI